jgi:hypothetical protein
MPAGHRGGFSRLELACLEEHAACWRIREIRATRREPRLASFTPVGGNGHFRAELVVEIAGVVVGPRARR